MSLKAGNQFRDGGAELEVSLLVEHHHRDAGNRLRHGIDAEDGIKFEGFRSGNILHTELFKMDEVCPHGRSW